MAELLKPVALGCIDALVCAQHANLRIVRYQPGTHFKRHAHETASICVVVQGAFEEDSADDRFIARVGDCVTKPPASFHANSFGEDETIIVQIESPSTPVDEDSSAWSGRYGIHRNPTVTARLFAAFEMLTIARRNDRLDDLIADAIAALQSRRRTARRPAWMTAVEERIASDAAVRVSQLAADAGVHPVHMARTFQNIHGCGVVDYMLRRRLARAAAKLASRDDSICRIAVHCGFYDQAHFTRAFCGRFGVTPLHYRRMLEGA